MGVLWDTAKFLHTHQNMELMKVYNTANAAFYVHNQSAID